MREGDTFSSLHPIVNFVFYIGALVLGMLLVHPVFLAGSLVLGTLYYLSVSRGRGWKFLLLLAGLFLLLTALNPLFNTYGEHILFHWPGGRPYTGEALGYGAALAAMTLSVILWFASYNTVMTSDKFLFLFGRLLPAASLILTMALRLVPSYQKQQKTLNGARRCIGKGTDTGTGKTRIENGITQLSALTSWALEGGMITADSMKSRGYGCGDRTTFSIYRWSVRDKILLGGMLAALAVVVFCALRGGADASFTPKLRISGFSNPYTTVGAAAYILFLAVPVGINFAEDVIWHLLRSGI